MAESPQRIDGWKAIAGHFRRSRSTVMRWATAPDFPIYRGPGGKSASVWAFAHELDAWLTARGDAAGEDAHQPGVSSGNRGGRFAVILVALALTLAVVTVLIAIFSHNRPRASERWSQLPADSVTADLYLQARDDWAARTPASLRKALDEFGEVTSRDPAFAPGYAGLADVYLMAREYDSMPDDVAYPKAAAAAKLSLTLDPGSAEANRALGFIAFWERRDIAQARIYFARSLQRDPNDAQTHFWFGNILVSSADIEAGLRELRAARRLDPGSQVIEVNYAMNLWYFDPNERNIDVLKNIADREPSFSDAHRFLSWAYLVKGDMLNYLDQREKLSSVESSPLLTAQVARERAAFKRGGSEQLLSVIANPPTVGDAYALQVLWPATAAAMLGRRQALLQFMARGEARHEVWGTWRVDQPRFTRWRADRQIVDGLKRLHALSSDFH